MEIENLIVVENIDEFLRTVSNISSYDTDMICYVSSLSNMLYWKSIESVWGKMGFVWDIVDDRGHFVNTSTPFTIIPKIPDGYRLKSTYNLLQNKNNISSIEIQKSDWSNLTDLGGMIQYADTKYIDVIADFSGAKFETINKQRTIKEDYSNRCLFPQGTHYIKMDLSNIKQLSYKNYDNCIASGDLKRTIFILDDNNKYFNIPLKINNLHWYSSIEWKGTGPFTYDYLFINMINSEYHKNYNVPVYSHNNQYYFKIKNNEGKFAINLEKYAKGSNYYNKTYEEILEDLKTLTEIELTINTSYDKTIGNIFYMGDDYDSDSRRHVKINYNIIGEVDSIYFYKAFQIFEESDLNDPLFKKQNYKKGSPFKSNILINKKDLIINTEGLEAFSIFNNSIAVYENMDDLKYIQAYSTYGYKQLYYLSPYKLINTENLKHLVLSSLPLYCNSKDYGSFYFLDESLELISINYTSYFPEDIYSSKTNSSNIIFGENAKLTISYYGDRDSSGLCFPSQTPIIKLKAFQNKIMFYHPTIIRSDVNKSYIINNIELDDNITREVLKNSYVNTYPESLRGNPGTYQVMQPIIISNMDGYDWPLWSSEVFFGDNIYYINCPEVYFNQNIGQDLLLQLIDALEIRSNTGTLSLYSKDYQLLTDSQKDYIINTLNYKIINKL